MSEADDTQDPNQVIEPADFQRAKAAAAESRLRINPMAAALASLFLILSLAVFFMFSAKAVRFVVEPADAELSPPFLSYQLGERYLMLSGTHQITASAPGYHTLTTEVTISDESEQQKHLTLTKLPGILTVLSEAPTKGAEVFIDQQPAGTTPITIPQVAAGLRDLTITHPRYQPYQTEINIEGKEIEQSL
ncbi:MAG: PEGA domain-containing protein, partial [Pseudomonadales bacterium]